MSIDIDDFVTIAAHAAEMNNTSGFSSKSVNMSEQAEIMSEYFILSFQSSIISKMLIHRISRLFLKIQECIPVGCVHIAAVAATRCHCRGVCPTPTSDAGAPSEAEPLFWGRSSLERQTPLWRQNHFGRRPPSEADQSLQRQTPSLWTDKCFWKHDLSLRSVKISTLTWSNID